MPQLTADGSYSVISWQYERTSFDRVAIEYSSTAVKSCKVKSCALDLVPASVITGCRPVLPSVMTDLVNGSLGDAFMPVALKTVMIIPVLKKSNLNSDDFKNFRPVPNLPLSQR